MRKRLLLLLSTFGLLGILIAPVSVGAIDVLETPCTTAPGSTLCVDNEETQSTGDNKIFGANGVLTKAARLLAIVIGSVSVVVILIGGFKYVTSSGDPTNIKSAKDTILFAIVGILVAVTAQSIVVFVLSRL